jgi:aryl-alcohol dehydrogenase-like predicted oxidoreductase
VPLDETWGAMAELAEQGLVRAIGMSNYLVGDIERCHAQRPVDVIQDGLSLVDHLDQREKIRRCGELGIAATVYEPLAGGVLSGKTAEQVLSTWTAPWTESPWFQRVLAPGRVERSFAVADGVRAVAVKLEATVAQVAIAWVLHQPGVAAAIAGSGSGHHTRENAAAADLRLDGVLGELDALMTLGPSFS